MYFEARHTGMTALPPTPMGAEGVLDRPLPLVDEPTCRRTRDGTPSHFGLALPSGQRTPA